MSGRQPPHAIDLVRNSVLRLSKGLPAQLETLPNTVGIFSTNDGVAVHAIVRTGIDAGDRSPNDANS